MVFDKEILDYATGLSQSELRWRNIIRITAIVNVGFAIAAAAITVFGTSSNQWTIGSWLTCVICFGITYCALVVQALSAAARKANIDKWIIVWMILIGLAAAIVIIGFLCFIGFF